MESVHASVVQTSNTILYTQELSSGTYSDASISAMGITAWSVSGNKGIQLDDETSISTSAHLVGNLTGCIVFSRLEGLFCMPWVAIYLFEFTRQEVKRIDSIWELWEFKLRRWRLTYDKSPMMVRLVGTSTSTSPYRMLQLKNHVPNQTDNTVGFW